MAETLVSVILDQLASMAAEEVKLVLGVNDEVRKLTSNFRAIQAVLEDAEIREVKEKRVGDWLDKLKGASYDMDDVLDEWNTSVRKLQIKKVENASKPMRKVCSLKPCFRFCFRQVFLRHDITHKIKELNRKLDVIALEKDSFSFSSKGIVELKRPETTSVIDVSEVHGRDQDKDTLINMLTKGSHTTSIPIISLVGMGGIGKTTLARLAFNDDKVKSHFDKYIWVCVSDPFDEMTIAKAILESLTNKKPKVVRLESILQEISKSLRGKKFFLVLDDMWTENPNDCEQLKNSLKCGSLESRILVTTRKESVANAIGTTNRILLGTLSEEKSWLLFCQFAFSQKTSEECKILEDIGRKIISKCNGLPLALKTLGSLLQFKTNIKEWQSVLDSKMWEVEEVERRIFPPLLLSYYDLPPTLRKCFTYCAIFPKDYKIEKDRLIELWMAQNYLREERTKDMELIGEECFTNLAMRSFFQDFEKNEYDGSIESCKMHDIVHDFAQFLTKNECFNIEIDDLEESRVRFSNEKTRHLMVRLKKGDSFPKYIYKAKNLRSLVVRCPMVRNMILSKLFCELTCLRTLNLSGCDMKILPSGIKKLIHLRYFDLSKNWQLKELPKTLCELYNLQTLNLKNCDGLKKLPQEMGKLINLRHLINNNTFPKSLRGMPKGIERLSSLRTLKEFRVGRNKQGSGLEYLKNLNNLRGSLRIIWLGEVENVCEINKANLVNKTNLLSLDLFFRRYEEVRENRNGIDDAIFETFILQAPPNLERLEISFYEGKTLSLNGMVSLTKLRFLVLWNCINWKYLPSLTKLSSLESLEIRHMKNIKRVGNEFLGMQSGGTPVIIFPKLKTLKLNEMDEWEEWDITKNVDEDIIIMPSLNFLTIIGCKKLKSLPDLILQTPTLKQLEILRCPILNQRYNKETGVDGSKICHIAHINICDS